MQMFLSAALSSLTGHAKKIPKCQKIQFVTDWLVNASLVLGVLITTLCLHTLTTGQTYFSEFQKV